MLNQLPDADVISVTLDFYRVREEHGMKWYVKESTTWCSHLAQISPNRLWRYVTNQVYPSTDSFTTALPLSSRALKKLTDPGVIYNA